MSQMPGAGVEPVVNGVGGAASFSGGKDLSSYSSDQNPRCRGNSDL